MLLMQHFDRYSDQERHVLCVGLDSLIYLDLATVICTLALSIAIGQLSLPRTWSSKCTIINQLYIKMF